MLKDIPVRHLYQTASFLVSVASVATSLLGLRALRKSRRDSAAITAAMHAHSKTPPTNTGHVVADGEWPHVAVLVPARNEQAGITRCLTSILAQDYPSFEVIAVDDSSTDQTPMLLADLQGRYPERLRVVQAGPLPVGGWLGKTHALWQGYAHVSPDTPWLLFVDADAALKPGALRAALGFACRQKLDLLSLIPATRELNFCSCLLLPVVLKFYLLAHLNPLHPAKPGSPEEASAIGTFILARHAAYRAVDGHSAVRGSTAEDVALAQRFRAHGFATLMTPGPDFVEADAYAGLDELWEGVGKNLFAVARGSWVTMLAVLAIEWFYGVVPVVLCVLPLLRRRRARAPMREQTAYWPVVVWLNRLAVSLVAVSFGWYLRVVGVPVRYVALYPLTAVLASLLFVDSARKVGLRRSVTWKGRTVKALPTVAR